MKVIKEKIWIGKLHREAWLYIGLPRDYDTTRKDYPVLYMHDGTNVFYDEDAYDGVSWGMIETLDDDPEIPRMIVVALQSAPGRRRLDEYGPYPFEIGQVGELPDNPGGLAADYLDYLVNDLKPSIDSRFRTRKSPNDTAIMGSSMGGVVSLYALVRHPEVFGRIASVSGAFFVALRPFLRDLREADYSHVRRIYLDCGDEETGGGSPEDYLVSNHEVYEVLNEKLTPSNLTYKIITGGKHHESHWRVRLGDILKTLFQ